jgi:hypothetical protein
MPRLPINTQMYIFIDKFFSRYSGSSQTRTPLVSIYELPRKHRIVTIPVQSELRAGTANSRQGSAASLAEISSMLQERFPGRGYCLVRDWTVFRADLTPQEVETIQSHGHRPLFLYAFEVVEDSRGRFQPGDWVRSSMCVSFDDRAMFETKNTVYVLLGPGSEQVASLNTIFSFF